MFSAATTIGLGAEQGLDMMHTTDGLLLAAVSEVEEALRTGAAMRIGDIIVGLIPSLEQPA